MFFLYFDGPVTCFCDNCGSLITMKRSKFERAKHHYCSQFCHSEHKKITFCGKHNHQYGLRGSKIAHLWIVSLNGRTTD